MKRSADQIAGGNPTSAIKRAASDADISEETEPSNLMILTSQNKALGLEMLSYKRAIAEGRKELELMRRKSREMESLVSLIQRAWSQLDIDSSMLLDSLGDSEVDVPDNGTSELLHRVLYAGSAYTSMDALNLDTIPKMDVDQWSSNEEIEQEKNRLESIINENVHNMNAQFGGTVAENLSAHASFTLSLLERLCNAINDCSSNGALQNPEQSENIAKMKEYHAEKLLLNDRIAKLTAELVNANAKLKISENEKLRVARKLDKAVVAAKEFEHMKSVIGSPGKPSTSAEGTAPTDGTSVAPTGGNAETNSAAAATAAAADAALEKELRRQIAVLERQVTESESAKSKVEMTLTERLARPLSQTETQVADMRRSMEELRQQSKQRVSALIQECDGLQAKVANLEIALQQVEQVTKTRMNELLAITEKEISTVKGQYEALQVKYSTAQADLAVTNQLKTQLAECQTIESLRVAEMKLLQNKLKMATQTQGILQENLQRSQERELALKQQLAGGEATTTTAAAAAAAAADIESESKLVADLRRELEDARNNVNDLILEIESVSDEEVKARSQAERIVAQISEYQSMQRVALEENMRLQDQIDLIKARSAEMESKMELMRNVMQQQENLLNQIRQSEQALRNDCQSLKKSASEVEGSRLLDEQRLLEAKQKLADSEHGVKSALKRNEELQSRCDELTSKCESERKSRLESQREVAKLAAAKKANKNAANSNSSSSSGSAGAGLSSEDADMLEMTLGMLRCSVCKDRFKSVAITRCFHLFCKECIDENLRNRQRKCPACGEKFGQDDVTNIFFTH